MENPLEIIGLRLVRIEQLLEDLIQGKSITKINYTEILTVNELLEYLSI